jgi:hypothetical protein
VSQTADKHAAFAREDIDDARRGRPEFDLRAYAAAHGLTFRDQDGVPPNYTFLGPSYPDYAFNWMTGVLPGGIRGALGHELLEVETRTKHGSRMGGKLWDERYKASDPMWFTPSFWRGRAKDGPFSGNVLFIPTTRALIWVPSAARAPQIKAMPSERVAPAGRFELERHGLPGFALNYGQDESPELLDHLFRGPVSEVLREFQHPYVEFELDGGMVSLRRQRVRGRGFAARRTRAGGEPHRDRCRRHLRRRRRAATLRGSTASPAMDRS